MCSKLFSSSRVEFWALHGQDITESKLRTVKVLDIIAKKSSAGMAQVCRGHRGIHGCPGGASAGQVRTCRSTPQIVCDGPASLPGWCCPGQRTREEDLHANDRRLSSRILLNEPLEKHGASSTRHQSRAPVIQRRSAQYHGTSGAYTARRALTRILFDSVQHEEAPDDPRHIAGRYDGHQCCQTLNSKERCKLHIGPLHGNKTTFTYLDACGNPVGSVADRRCSVKDEPIAIDTALGSGAHAITQCIINRKLTKSQDKCLPGG